MPIVNSTTLNNFSFYESITENGTNETLDWVSQMQNSTIYRIQLWVIPFLVVFGAVGNVVSLRIFCSPSFAGYSSSCYLAVLAGSDTVFLFTLALVWLSNTVKDLYNLHIWCQGITYLTSVTTFVSVWVIVAFTVERFVAVCYPLLKPSVCTVKRARLVVSIVAVLGMILYSYLLLAAGVEPTHPDEILRCTLKTGWGSVAAFMNTTDLILTLVVPVIAIVSLNMKIARCVYFVDKLGNRDPNGSAEVHLELHLLSESHNKVDHRHRNERSTTPEFSRQCVPNSNKSRKAQNNVTKMLLVISTIFIILNLPSYAIRAYMYFTSLYEVEVNWHSIVLYNLQQSFTLLFYSNFAINFLLYCATGQNFRRAVKTIFLTRARHRNLPRAVSTPTRTRLTVSFLQRSTILRRTSQTGRPVTALMLGDFTEGANSPTPRKSPVGSRLARGNVSAVSNTEA